MESLGFVSFREDVERSTFQKSVIVSQNATTLKTVIKDIPNYVEEFTQEKTADSMIKVPIATRLAGKMRRRMR